MRTLGELMSAIETEMQLDPGLISDEERSRFINDCLSDLGTLSLLEKSADVASVDGFVSLPTDLVEIIDVFWEDILLRPLESNNMTGSSAKPIGYITYYDNIKLYPTPNEDGNVKLIYSYRPSSLNITSDKPDIPEGWDYLLVDYAVGRAHRKNGNIGLYREYMGAYEEGKVKLMTELTKRQNSRITPTVDSNYPNRPDTPYDYL